MLNALTKKSKIKLMCKRSKIFVDNVINLMNVNKIRKTVNTCSEILDTMKNFSDKPTLFNGIIALFGTCKILYNETSVYADDYFCCSDWVMPHSEDFNQIIINAIANYPHTVIKTPDDAIVIKIVNIDDIKIGYSVNIKMNEIEYVHVMTDKLEQSKLVIKKLLWEKYKDMNLIMRLNKFKPIKNATRSVVVFESDDLFKSMTSQRAREYSLYLKRCIDAGVFRSVLLYGPPGTGKSTMAKTLVDLLNMRSFRIRVDDLSYMESSTLFEAIEIFEPDAIIFDDFDRSKNQTQLLETLEFFQRHIKLVIATVNDRNNLDEALLRPGRFDELVFVNQIEEDVVKTILGPDMLDAYDVVKNWPVAFIQEYVKRRKFMSIDEATESTKELAIRVKRLEKYEDINDIERMNSICEKNVSNV